ncbi:MAG: hypothetical protein V1923_02405 [Candidatus Omnitrophota bacterium]
MDGEKFIKTFFPKYGSQHYQLFNIERDPAELVDLKSTEASQFKEYLFKLSQEARKMKSVAKKAGFFNLTEEVKEKLRSLGYVQ